jgi:hypothetical protein
VSRDEILTIQSELSAGRSIKMDWLGMESMIRAIYRLDTDDTDKLDLIAGAVEVYTKRGRP